MGQVSASNWAQVSGSREQNIDVNNYPSAAHPHWQPRYGMAVVKVSNISIFNDLGNVLLMGGDVYDPNQPASPTAPFDERYGGGYKNDVWQMTPVNWQVLPDQTGWKNKFG